MSNKFDNSLIQYYEFELERVAPRGVEADNSLLPTIDELVLMLTEDDETIDDGSKMSHAWSDQESDTQSRVYFHELTGWSVLLRWHGHHGAEGHSLQYFNHVHANPGFIRRREFGGSIDLVAIYQNWVMDVERPFWDLYSAIVERGEALPQIDNTGYEDMLKNLELGLGDLL